MRYLCGQALSSEFGVLMMMCVARECSGSIPARGRKYPGPQILSSEFGVLMCVARECSGSIPARGRNKYPGPQILSSEFGVLMCVARECSGSIPARGRNKYPGPQILSSEFGVMMCVARECGAIPARGRKYPAGPPNFYRDSFQSCMAHGSWLMAQKKNRARAILKDRKDRLNGSMDLDEISRMKNASQYVYYNSMGK